MRDYLFAFATTRNPKTLSDTERATYHVRMPDSVRPLTFYWSTLPVPEGQARTFEQAIEIIREQGILPDIKSLNMMRTEHILLLTFFRKLRSEDHRSNFDGVPQFALELGVTPLTTNQKVDLWDQLAFRLWIARGEEEVELITTILVADKAIEALNILVANEPDMVLSQSDERHLRRVLSARVVLPLRVLNLIPPPETPRLSRRQREMLEHAHDRLISGDEIKSLEKARLEILDATARIEIERKESDQLRLVALENSLRSSLAGSANDENAIHIARNVTSEMRANEVRSDPLLEVRTKLPSADAKLVLNRFAGAGDSVDDVINTLTDHIEELEEEADAEIATTDSSSLLVFGTEITVEENVPTGAVILKAHKDSENRYHLYLTYFHDQEAPLLIALGGTIEANGQHSQLVTEMLPMIDNRFQSFRLTQAPISDLLIQVHLTALAATLSAEPTTLDPQTITTVTPAFFVPHLGPDFVPSSALEPPPLFGINKLGFMDYRRVEQELSCYVTGEVSHIENILASEFKERVSRSLSVIENEQEVTTELSSEKQSDTETSDRHEMQSEVASVLAEEKEQSIDLNAGVDVNAETVHLSSNVALNFNSHSSKEDSTSQAITLARSITRKVQEKIVRKSTIKRRSLSRKEFEDVYKHGFDNRQNTEHVVGVFRWLDKIMDNHLVNYGNMNVIEFEIPEPARNFIKAQMAQVEADPFKGNKPAKPRKIGLNGPKSVKRHNYLNFAKEYGVDLPEPPPKKIFISGAFGVLTPAPPHQIEVATIGEDTPKEMRSFSPASAATFNEIQVPEGYQAVRGSWIGKSDDINPFQVNTTFAVFIGSSPLRSTNSLAQDTVIDLPWIEGLVPVAAYNKGSGPFVLTVTIECKLKDSAFRAWQLAAYTNLIDRYHGLKKEYDAAREEHMDDQNTADLNPHFKRQLMQREIKRICIEMMAVPFGIDFSQNHYGENGKKNMDKLLLTADLDAHAKIVRWFEGAFMWNIASYIFYPYFYLEEKDWRAKLSLDATQNELFASFLTSGMARVMLPVRRGFEEAVMYFLQTGDMWFGANFVLESKNDLNLSVADEIVTANEEVVIEDTWQTKLPTNHTIVQSAAAAFIAEGLPCRFEDEKVGVGTSRLTPVLPPDPSPG